MEGFNNCSNRKIFALNVAIDDFMATITITVAICRSIATVLKQWQQIFYLAISIISNPFGNGSNRCNRPSIVTVSLALLKNPLP